MISNVEDLLWLSVVDHTDGCVWKRALKIFAVEGVMLECSYHL